jgi:tetratricopeptide (TPR) repeat protein
VTYSLRRTCRIVRLPESIVDALVGAGIVAPIHGRRGALHFDFHDLAVLRRLSARGAEARRAAPAPGRQLVARGARPVVLEADGLAWDAESGQSLLDLEGQGSGTACVIALQDPADDEGDRWFEAAIALEPVDRQQAIKAYRCAINAAPWREDAYLNLGELLQEAGDAAQALDVYLQGADQCVDSALLRFNCGVLFQLLSAYREAESCYLEALARDPTLGDAHHNLAMMYLELGEDQQAIRHYNELRRVELRN